MPVGSRRDWKVGSLLGGPIRDGQRGDVALHRARISRSSGSIVRGPREQLRPTTSAPASSRRLHASPTTQTVAGRVGLVRGKRDDGGHARRA